ncbi:hypothetical protein PIB30_057105 [Stylosanthes scabra]|uniref:F-box domain-containing protein n=1 Tax=Stylosanthes scabra TaxID=79078 RepID=A0ABU6XL76_9FABA|nr:hypothetical protein [Stylosanthes scabra]
MENQRKGINEFLPLEILRSTLLRVLIKPLVRLKQVCIMWYNLISDHDFAKSHFDQSFARGHTCIFIQKESPKAYFVDLDTLPQEDSNAIISVSLPFKWKTEFTFLGTCRGIVLLHSQPQFLVFWNPTTKSRKGISYSHMFDAARRFGEYNSPVALKAFNILRDTLLHGFGYDELEEDYIAVFAYRSQDEKNHFDIHWLGRNSSISLDWKSPGLFCNHAIHWSSDSKSQEILIFDLKGRAFSKISMPEELEHTSESRLALLGGCLALYSSDGHKTDVWVMKEYKKLSSWFCYEIPNPSFGPLCLSGDGDIIGYCDGSDDEIGFCVFNVGQKLLTVRYVYGVILNYTDYIVYEDSLLQLPGSI